MKSSEFGGGFWVNIPLEHLKNIDHIFAAVFVVRVAGFDQKVDVGQQVLTANGKQKFSEVSLIFGRGEELGNDFRIAEVALLITSFQFAHHLFEEKSKFAQWSRHFACNLVDFAFDFAK